MCQRVVSSTFKIVQTLVHSHFDLISSLLALEATELVPKLVTHMAFILFFEKKIHFYISINLTKRGFELQGFILEPKTEFLKALLYQEV